MPMPINCLDGIGILVLITLDYSHKMKNNNFFFKTLQMHSEKKIHIEKCSINGSGSEIEWKN